LIAFGAWQEVREIEYEMSGARGGTVDDRILDEHPPWRRAPLARADVLPRRHDAARQAARDARLSRSRLNVDVQRRPARNVDALELRRATSDAHATTHDVKRQRGAGDRNDEKDEVFAANHHDWIIGSTRVDFKSRSAASAFNSAM
jgi:hypothetical protein